MTAETTPIVNVHDHVCLIHYGETSRRPVLLQWAREGLAEGERIVLLERPSNDSVIAELVGDGAERLAFIDPNVLFGSGDDGSAITQRLLDLAVPSHGDGPKTARVSSPAAPALAVNVEEIYLEYERSVGRAVEEQPIAMLCQYDQVAIDDDLVARAAAEHEIVVQLDDLALPTLDLRPTPDGIRVSGEIDIANHSVVEAWMSRHRGGPLIVDCANLTFLDVAGLRALCAFASESAPITLEHVNGVPATLFSALPLGSMPANVAIGRRTR